jgi:hypothetical protein
VLMGRINQRLRVWKRARISPEIPPKRDGVLGH